MTTNISKLWPCMFLYGLLALLPITAKAQYGSTVREAILWDYEYSISRWPLSPSDEIISGYHFSGTRIEDGKTYAIFRDNEDKELALVRQEDSKLFLYVPSEDSVGTEPPYVNAYDSAGERIYGDILLYDFSLQKGERFKSLGFDDMGELTAVLIEFEITDVYTEYYGDIPYRCQEFVETERLEECGGNPNDIPNKYKVIEGVGNKVGLLPFPQIANYTSGGCKYYAPYRVVDTTGTVLYGNPDTVAKIAMVTSGENETVYYDSYGRKTAIPSPGNIYICNGKKILMK